MSNWFEDAYKEALNALKHKRSIAMREEFILQDDSLYQLADVNFQSTKEMDDELMMLRYEDEMSRALDMNLVNVDIWR